MTADEWDATADYRKVWDTVLGYYAPNRSTRKCYCFGLAAVKLRWEEMSPAAREVVAVIEAYVEKRASNSERAAAQATLRSLYRQHGAHLADMAVYWAACAPQNIKHVGYNGALNFVDSEALRPELLRLIRDIFPNPHRTLHIDPAWLAWCGGTVRRIAQAINNEGDFGRVAVLADALEDAGCDEAHLLGHLRSAGPHVRGCWAVDLILGKE